MRSVFEQSIFESLFYYKYSHQLLVQDLLKYIELSDMLVVFFNELMIVLLMIGGETQLESSLVVVLKSTIDRDAVGAVETGDGTRS